MRSPKYILKTGTKVFTHDELDESTSINVNSALLSARRACLSGVIAGVVGGHGGDVYFVKHVEGTAVYCFTEFELIGGEE